MEGEVGSGGGGDFFSYIWGTITIIINSGVILGREGLWLLHFLAKWWGGGRGYSMEGVYSMGRYSKEYSSYILFYY